MAPNYVKGGVWTNVEDEILKAAVSKYGLNQWSRVSSLLARKTAQQAKARWNEWLDPSIKKIEWTREEDEKLLRLAKLMPTQWRTIAPLVGRTATQCLERYQKLLEDAESAEAQDGELKFSASGIEAVPGQNGSKTSLARQVNTSAEAQPARPDAVDMDEDEKEMLSEARARLANTQGKKAKRKDRERLLEQSRRVALLQKRRELKNAGIITKLRRKKNDKEIDYSEEIPFQRPVAKGFYDTSSEDKMNEAERTAFQRKVNEKGLKHEQITGSAIGKPKTASSGTGSGGNKRQAGQSAQDAAAVARIQRQLAEEDRESVAKRRKLVLPEPKAKAEDIEAFVKEAETAQSLAAQYGIEAGHSVAGSLLPEVSDVSARISGTKDLRTVSETTHEERIAQAVRDIEMMNEAKSSLLGEETANVASEEFTVPRTGRAEAAAEANAAPIGQTPSLLKASVPPNGALNSRSGGGNLKSALENLPAPKNTIELVLPDEPMEELEQPEEPAEEDEATEERRQRLLEQEREAEALRNRPEAVIRGLPVPSSAGLLSGLDNPLEEEIWHELRTLVGSGVFPDKEQTMDWVQKEISVQFPDFDPQKAAAAAAESSELSAELVAFLSSRAEAQQAAQLDEYVKMINEKVQAAHKTYEKVTKGYRQRESTLSEECVARRAELAEVELNFRIFSGALQSELNGIAYRKHTLQDELEGLLDAERSLQAQYADMTVASLSNGAQS